MTTFYTPWRPIFDSPPAHAAVANDARLSVVQQQDFLARARRMGANERECKEIVEALQLCERLYGFKKVDGALSFVEGLLACATVSLGVPLSRVAALCSQPTAGALAGALIEQSLGVDPPTRQFPIGHALAPPAGFGLAFGDCVVASRWMDALGLLTAGHVDRLRAYAQLARAIRTQAGGSGLQRAVEMLKHAASTNEPEQAFIRAIAEEAQLRRFEPGLAWNWYVRMTQRPTLINTWVFDVAPPAEEAQ
jgi:hypothetical protein